MVVLIGLLVAALVALGVPSVRAGGGAVELVRTPDGGIQPQAVVDVRGVTHLLYYRGTSGAGDLFYRSSRSRPKGPGEWSAALRVNSVPNSAIAAGTIRGGQLAVGRAGRVHVVWNGSGAVSEGNTRSPMLYSRLNDAGTAFEPQRNLMRHTAMLDGGGTVAADDRGHVQVMWHAQEASLTAGNEQARKIWTARSNDDGRTFAPEAPAFTEPTGVCPCCSIKAFADRKGGWYVLYRIARDKTGRDMYLLTSRDGERFQGTPLDPWPVPT